MQGKEDEEKGKTWEGETMKDGGLGGRGETNIGGEGKVREECFSTTNLCPRVPPRMVGSRKVVVSALLVLNVALVLVVLLPPSASAASNRKVTVCIKNCGQCKKMYTDYFNGGLCGDFCVRTKGRFIPDCNKPDVLIDMFLQRLE